MPNLGSYESVPGEFYGTPKELYALRYKTRGTTPRARACAFLLDHFKLLGLRPDLRDLELVSVRRGLRTWHVIFKQLVHGLRVRRGYVSVHLDAGHRVYLVKNRAVPQGLLPPAFVFRGEQDAVAIARATLPKGARRLVQKPEKMWFPDGAATVPVYRVRLQRNKPREAYDVFVRADTGEVLRAHDNVARARGKATLFDPSPVTALGDHHTLLDDEGDPRLPPENAYKRVTLQGLRGNGHLDGTRVTTNRTHPKKRVRVRNHDFSKLRSSDKGFDEVMVYHHIDGAIRYLEDLGYRGKLRIFKEPLRVNVNGTREDNAWYDPTDRSLMFGTGEIDEAEDGETILHEFGHALQDAICPEFGQSREGWALGEGFGDYFAGSYFEQKKPLRYKNSVITWDGLLIGIEEGREPPCMRHLDGELTYDDFKPRGDEHDNGEIWSATLWEVRGVLGRRMADKVIIESHFQLDPYATFARAARAIIDCNRILNADRHRHALRNVFRRRQIDGFRASDDME